MSDSETVLAKAQFIEDVGKFLQGKAVDKVIEDLNNHHSKFRMIENQLVQSKARLLTKLPEIQKSLDIVTALLNKADTQDGLVIDYELAESVYAKAKVKKAQSVNLWLGANVMVEYPLKEAQELLVSNLTACKSNLKATESDLELIKDNLTTLEVSISRVWNHDVEMRKRGKAAAIAAS